MIGLTRVCVYHALRRKYDRAVVPSSTGGGEAKEGGRLITYVSAFIYVNEICMCVCVYTRCIHALRRK